MAVVVWFRSKTVDLVVFFVFLLFVFLVLTVFFLAVFFTVQWACAFLVTVK